MKNNKVFFKKSNIINNIDMLSFLIPYALKNTSFKKSKNFFKAIFNKKAPYFFLIDPINLCNLKCDMCFTKQIDHIEKSPLTMDFSSYKKLIDKYKESIIYNMFGCLWEPTLNPDIYKMLDYSMKNQILPFLTTNFAKVDIEKLLNTKLPYLQISLSAGNRELYNEIHGVDLFDKVIKNLKTLVYFKKKKNLNYPFIHVKSVLQKKNEKHISEIRDILKNINGIQKYSVKKFQSIMHLDNVKEILPKNPKFYMHETGYNTLNNIKKSRNNSMFYIGPDNIISKNETTYIINRKEKR